MFVESDEFRELLENWQNACSSRETGSLKVFLQFSNHWAEDDSCLWYVYNAFSLQCRRLELIHKKVIHNRALERVCRSIVHINIHMSRLSSRLTSSFIT